MHIPEQPHIGMIIRYDYLWHSESLSGMENGVKSRPCAVVLVKAGERVLVMPITHTKPHDLSLAVEIPSKTKARLGLDAEKSWIICSELNEFQWPGPDLSPIEHRDTVEYGTIPNALLDLVKAKMLYLHGGRSLKIVSRTV